MSAAYPPVRDAHPPVVGGRETVLSQADNLAAWLISA
jgi:hypothetical protein